MHKLEIKLKQHTPLIHFQHDQDGATLRASEVKPKLDKFILKQLGGGDYEKGKAEAKAKGWLVGKGDHPALDYKTRIESPKRVLELKRSNGFKKKPKTGDFVLNEKGEKILKYETMPLFFGNMNDKEPKNMVMADEEISLSFFSLHDKLLNYINANINSFFFLTNFGTRQSKGFGSYYPKVEKLPDSTKGGDYYFFEIETRRQRGDWKDFYTLFQYIDLFYKTLRSGINQNGSYFKSMMYHYAKEKEEYWDKRAIRTHFELFTATIDKEDKKIKVEALDNIAEKKKNDLGENHDTKTDAEKGNLLQIESSAKLYRDMLGYSTTQDWMKYGATINKIVNDVERYKSPILIKPLYNENTHKYVIYVIPLETEIGIQNKEVEISVEYKAKNNKNPELLKKRLRRNQSSGKMKTPSAFSISDYLYYVFCGKGNTIAKEQIKDMPPGFIRDYLCVIYGIQ